MPHRVASFFRQHSFEHADLKKATRTPSSSGSSLASNEDKSVKMPFSAHGHGDNKKRRSIPGLHHSPRSSSQKIPQHLPVTLSMDIESPPLVFYGAATSSTGALLSGQVKIQVNEDILVIDALKMRMVLEVTRKQPFKSNCKECMNQSTDLNTWDFLHGPATLRRGEHSFPFSFLLPGHLPASMKGALSTIDYVLRASVTPRNGEPLKLAHPLILKRSIPAGDNPRNSIRIFPPTNLTAQCQLPPVIYPIGETNISMRIDGIVKRNVDGKTQSQWRLKRVTWRLDETQKTISPACPKHAAKLAATGEDAKKGILHQDVRTIGFEELKSGWKSDYSGPDGNVELEFPFGIQANSHSICDMKAEDGTEVSHVLVVEMIVTEEIAPVGKPKQITPTGAARVLRMHFNVIVTERGGMGISWDEEQPPLYENVPASPPTYGQSEDLPEYRDLQPLEGISQLSLSGDGGGQSSSGSGA